MVEYIRPANEDFVLPSEEADAATAAAIRALRDADVSVVTGIARVMRSHEALRAERDTLRAALAFYGERANYDRVGPAPPSIIDVDYGQRARAALAGVDHVVSESGTPEALPEQPRHPITGRWLAFDCEVDCLEHCAGLCGTGTQQ